MWFIVPRPHGIHGPLTTCTDAYRLALTTCLQVLVLHIQYFVIITRLAVLFPNTVIQFAAAIGSITATTGSLSFGAACLSTGGMTPSEQAAAQITFGLTFPMAVICFALGLWAIWWVAPPRAPPRAVNVRVL